MKTEYIAGIAIVVIAILLFAYACVGGGPINLSGNYRDFWQNMGTGDLGTVSTFDGSYCEPQADEQCVILNGHWENMDATGGTGTYVLRCRCFKLEG